MASLASQHRARQIMRLRHSLVMLQEEVEALFSDKSLARLRNVLAPIWPAEAFDKKFEGAIATLADICSSIKKLRKAPDDVIAKFISAFGVGIICLFTADSKTQDVVRRHGHATDKEDIKAMAFRFEEVIADAFNRPHPLSKDMRGLWQQITSMETSVEARMCIAVWRESAMAEKRLDELTIAEPVKDVVRLIAAEAHKPPDDIDMTTVQSLLRQLFDTLEEAHGEALSAVLSKFKADFMDSIYRVAMALGMCLAYGIGSMTSVERAMVVSDRKASNIADLTERIATM